MSCPTPEQVQIVIDNLIKAQKIADNNCPVNMAQGVVEFAHPCGTPMCHGGWYAIATVANDNDRKIMYYYGAATMAQHLGFLYEDDLERYMKNYPEIWGNRWGDLMFCDEDAFEFTEELTLQDIIDHWKQVKENIINQNKTNV